MFKPCPNCGFLVALIAGRESSQRCPRCGSALVGDAGTPDISTPPRDVAAPSQPVAAPARSDAVAAGDTPTPETAASTSATAADIRAAQPAPSPDVPAMAPARDRFADASGPAPLAADEPAAARIEPTPHGPHDGPSFMHRRHAPRTPYGRLWPWALAVAGLGLLLALQLVLAQRTELARNATWRPLVVQVCGVLGCGVPDWHEPRAFAMVARGVRPHASRAGVLHATATVRNDARWPQPAPVVVLSLADIDGRLVGARAVAPREYGHGASLVAPGESLDIAFDVREPTGRVESFDFQLQ